MTKQVMQIACQPQALLDHGQACKLLPRVMQLPDCPGQAGCADHVKAKPANQQHKWDELQPVHLGNASTCTDTDYEWEENENRDHQEGAAHREHGPGDGADADEEPEER